MYDISSIKPNIWPQLLCLKPLYLSFKRPCKSKENWNSGMMYLWYYGLLWQTVNLLSIIRPTLNAIDHKPRMLYLPAWCFQTLLNFRRHTMHHWRERHIAWLFVDLYVQILWILNYRIKYKPAFAFVFCF